MDRARVERARKRRGNTLILVAGVLALLTIIAAVFLTRTKGTRDTAAAIQRTMSSQTRVDHIAEMLAKEVALSLFPEPFGNISAGFLPGGRPRASSNLPRLLTESSVYAGSIVHDRYGWDPDNPWNYASHKVVPWTNWPDSEVAGSLPGHWPEGPGSPTPAVALGYGWKQLSGCVQVLAAPHEHLASEQWLACLSRHL
ncbi:MAG: hypothetical protein ACYTGP_05775 [Planctomycetota bacterium]|jgi:hypothetical protein